MFLPVLLLLLHHTIHTYTCPYMLLLLLLPLLVPPHLRRA